MIDDLDGVTRVELIDNIDGRVYTCYNVEVVSTSLQDDGRTLKVFVWRKEHD